MCMVRRVPVVPAGTSSLRSVDVAPTKEPAARMRFMVAVVIASCLVVFALALVGCVRTTVAPSPSAKTPPAVEVPPPAVVAVAPPAAVRKPPPVAAPPIAVPPPVPLTPPVIAPMPTVARAPSPAPKTASKAAPPAALDLTSLEARLRATSAIGTFTKLSLKNQVSDLIDQFKTFHHGGTPAVATLRQKYDLLLLKVLSLLQDDDASLAGAISASRESIWGLLVDPAKFSKVS